MGGRLGSAQSSNQPQYAFSPSPFLSGFSPYQNGRLPQTYSISIRNSWLLSSSTVLQKKHEKIVKFLLSYGKLTICTSFSFRCSLLDKHVIELNIFCSSLLSYLPLPNLIDEWNIPTQPFEKAKSCLLTAIWDSMLCSVDKWEPVFVYSSAGKSTSRDIGSALAVRNNAVLGGRLGTPPTCTQDTTCTIKKAINI